MHIFQRVYRWLTEREIVQVKIAKALFVAVILNLLFGAGFYVVEHQAQPELTLPDAVWWAMVTMTTVGYGDYAAQTPAGRFLISYPCMVLGIGVIGYLIGAVAESVLERMSKKRRGLMQIRANDHFIICNCPAIPKVQLLVKELRAKPEYRDRMFVVVSEAFGELPEDFENEGIKFVKGDPMREEVLARANIVECAGVFILAENPKDAASDEKTFAVGTIVEMLKRERGLAFKVVVELASKENLKMMRRSNVDGIVTPDGITDCLMAQEFASPGVHDIVHQLISNTVGSQLYILDTRLAGRRVSDIQVAVINHPANMQVIGIGRQGRQILNPPKEMLIEQDDKLIMLAESAADYHAVEEAIMKS
ncbi:MAG: hypothetical protein GY868_04385 [Deltaproteobacteria bacterium]|nr:hypothetical protein [Deltaproteobacteria bacterium]